MAVLGLWQVSRAVAVARRAMAVVTSQSGMLGMAPAGVVGAAEAQDQVGRMSGRLRQARAGLRTGSDTDHGRDDAEKAARASSVL